MKKLKEYLKKRNTTRLKLSGAAFAGALVMALGFYLAATLLLPAWIEKKLQRTLTTLSGTQSVHCESLKIDLFGADLGKLSIGAGTPPPLSFESCSLKFNPISLLLQGKISKITLSGLDINVLAKDGKLSLEGLRFGADASAPAPKAKPQIDPASVLAELDKLPVSISRLELRNAELNIQGNDISLVVPFELTLKPEGDDWSAAEADIEISPNGQKLNASFRASRAGDSLNAHIWTPKKIRLESIPFGYMMPAGSSVFGNLDIESHFTIAGKPAAVTDLTVDAKIEKLRFRCGQFRLLSSLDAPATLKIRHGEGKGSLELAGLRLGGSVPLELKSASSVYSFKSGSVKATTGIAFINTQEGTTLAKPANVLLEAKADFKGGGRYEISASGRLAGETPSLELDFKGTALSSASPVLELQASSDGKAASFNGSIQIPKLKLISGSSELEAADLSLMARNAEQGAFAFDAMLSNCAIKAGSLSAKIPKALLEGESKDGVAKLCASFENASGIEKNSSLAFDGMGLKLPFKWPLSAEGSNGELSVKSFTCKGVQLGSLNSTLTPKSNGFDASGDFISAKIPGLKASFSGSSMLGARSFEMKSKFGIPKFKLAQPFDLGSAFPKAKGTLVSGEFLLDGSCAMDWRGPSGSLIVQASGASIKSADGKYSIEGIDASLELPHLPVPQSSPSQRISFKKVSYGKLTMANGIASIRLDAPSAIFVESLRADWCQGKIRAQSFLVGPSAKGYDLTLHCDRISIAEFLGQLGVGHADGEGTLNGTIPLNLKNGVASFQDAFLYSTPGDSGTLKLDDNGLLTAGLQDGTPEYTSLDIARESLKNFSYSWAKITLDTQGETVAIKLQLDGKPIAPLPFRVEDGQYIRDDKNKLAFQGIRLDLNFNVPLAKVIGLSGDLKGLLQPGANAK